MSKKLFKPLLFWQHQWREWSYTAQFIKQISSMSGPLSYFKNNRLLQRSNLFSREYYYLCIIFVFLFVVRLFSILINTLMSDQLYHHICNAHNDDSVYCTNFLHTERWNDDRLNDSANKIEWSATSNNR
jgi:hypothetical protein